MPVLARTSRGLALAALVLGGCSSAASDDVEPRVPTLLVSSPERGTLSDQSTVTVEGEVSDDGAVNLTVNGIAVTPEASGHFSVALDVGAGLALIETHAIDADGNDVVDVRAVLAGAVAPTDGSLAAPIAARADAATLAKVGDAIANTAEQIDFNAAVKALNPVFEDGGCLGAKVDVTSVELSNIDVALAPVAGAFDVEVGIDDVVVKAHVNYKAACIGGSTNVTIRSSRARIGGALGVALSGGKLATSLPSPSVALDGFSFDVGGVPGAVEDLLRSKVRDAVANALKKVIRDRVPGMADGALAGLIAKPRTIELFGHPTQLAVTPTTLAVSPDALFLVVDGTVAVDGGAGGVFVPTPAEPSPALMAGGQGLGLALADDLANQLFAGLWATGAFDLSLSIDQLGPAAILFDDDVRTLEVKMSLPPQVRADGTQLALEVGDLILTGRDDAGADVQQLALSVRTTLVATPTGTSIALALGEPDLHAQVLAESEAVQTPLEREKVEGIINGAWGLIAIKASDALAALPLPSLGGVQLGAPAITGRDGFVVTDVPLQ